MAEKKLIDMDGLAFFKQRQDDFNDVKFMHVADFVNENGVILNDKLPDNTTAQVATLNEISELFE